jgi:hypothetical protein
LTYNEELDSETNLKKFSSRIIIIIIINQVFHPAKVRKHARLSAYKTLATSISTHGCRYVPIGRRLPGRPKRRWLEIVTGHEA